MSLFLFKTPKQESGKNGSSCLISLLPILSLLALAGCSTSALTTSPPSAAPPESSTTNISFDQPAKSKIDVLDKVSIDAAQAKEIGLEIGEVKHGFIIKTVEAPGSVGRDAELSRLVSTPSAGRATEVKARLGDAVKVGQVMAIIKSDPIGQVQSDLLQNTLQAKADIKQQEVQLKLSRVTY